MSSELYMECEEEELEPWQREVMEDDEEEEEEMNVVCQVKQEQEFVNGPGFAVSSAPPPAPSLLRASPLIGSSFTHGVSLIGPNRSQGLSLIGPGVTQRTSLTGSNIAPVMSVIGPNVPTMRSVIGSQNSQTRSLIGSNLTPGSFTIGSNVTPRTGVTRTQFSLATSVIGSNRGPAASVIGSNHAPAASVIGSNRTPAASVIGSNRAPAASVIGSNHAPAASVIGSNRAPAASVIGSNRGPATSVIGSGVPAGASAIGPGLPQGPPLILTQGPGGTFFLSTGQLAPGQQHITGSSPNQPFLFTTQGLVPVQTSGGPHMPKLLLNLQTGQTTLIQHQPVVRAKIAPKEQAVSVTSPPSSLTPTLTPTLIPTTTASVAPVRNTPPSPQARPAPPSRYTAKVLPAPVSITTATPGPNPPTKAIPRIVISKTPKAAVTTATETSGPSTPLRVVMTVDEFYYGVFTGDQSMQQLGSGKLSSPFHCKNCLYTTKRNMEMMKHYWQHTDMARSMQHEDMRCDDCFRLFSSTALLEKHLQGAHLSRPKSTVCRICEWVFDNEMEFLNHMKTNHKPGELPYVCQVCSYRSSFYSDVLQHFRCYHSGRRHLLCILCLKVTNNIKGFQNHMDKHKLKESHPCAKCRLQFTLPTALLEHKQQHHRSFRRPHQLTGLPPGAMVTIKTVGANNHRLPLPSRVKPSSSHFRPPLVVPPSQQQPIESSPPDPTPPGPAPTGAKLKDNSDTESAEEHDRLLCLECGNTTSDFSSHYPSSVSCLLCSYTTFCSCAYASHMIQNHVLSRERGKPLPLHQRPPPCRYELMCTQCGFVSLTGDKMAKHLGLNRGHVSSICRPHTTPKEPDILFRLQSRPPPDPLPPGGSPDPGPPTWTRAPGGPPSRRPFPFKQTRGPRHTLAKTADAVDYFLLAYPEPLLELIAKETNAHVKTCRYLGVATPHWTPLGVPELKAFLGLVILMGVHGLADLGQYWDPIASSQCDLIDRAMSLRRFKQVAANVRMGSLLADQVCGGGGEPRDSLRVLRPTLKLLSEAMWKVYRPNCNLTIDRTPLPALEGRAGDPPPDGQTLPEIWLLCDSKSGYCHRLHLHGRRADEDQEALGLAVVPRLIRGLHDKNHRLYLAGALASPRLMCQLLLKGVYASSSFPARSPVLPEALWEEGDLAAPGHYLQWRRGPLLATRWRDAKEMGCLCTNAVAGNWDTVWRRSQTEAGKLDPLSRPMAFRLLQENMRGVDICKQLLACNPLGGVPRDRHWRSLFWFLLNLSVVNAFIVLRESRQKNPPHWVEGGLFSQLKFRRRLGTQLARCYQRPPGPEPPVGGEGEEEEEGEGEAAEGEGDPLKEAHRMTKISFRTRRCKNCDVKQVRHESVYGCSACKVNLCTQSSCFWEFHGLAPTTKVSPRVGFTRDKISGDIQIEGQVVRRTAAAPRVERPDSPEDREDDEDEATADEEEAVAEEEADPLRYTFRPEDEEEEFLAGEAAMPHLPKREEVEEEVAAAPVANAAVAVASAAAASGPAGGARLWVLGQLVPPSGEAATPAKREEEEAPAAVASGPPAAVASAVASGPAGGAVASGPAGGAAASGPAGGAAASGPAGGAAASGPAGGAAASGPAGGAGPRAPLSAQQLRVCLVALCSGLQHAAYEFVAEPSLVRAWVELARRRWGGGAGPAAPGEDHMVEWVWFMREQQLPITEGGLFQHAATLKKNGVFGETFRISYNWAVGLMLRHRLGPPAPARAPGPPAPLPPLMENGVRSFTEFTRRQVDFHQMALSAVAGVTRLSVFLDRALMKRGTAPALRSLALRLSGTGTPLMTAYLTALADGTLLPALVLLWDPTRLGGPLDAGADPPSFLVETDPHGFTSAEGLEVWVKRVWRPHVSAPGRPRKRLLVLDRHRDHVAEAFLGALGQTRTLPALIPSGCSQRLQPLRVAVLPVLQRLLAARWRQLSAGPQAVEHADTARQRLGGWLQDALNVLRERPSLIKASFRLTGLVPGEEGGPGEGREEVIRSMAFAMLCPEDPDPQEPLPVKTEEGGGGGGGPETAVKEEEEEEEVHYWEGEEEGGAEEQKAGTSSKRGRHVVGERGGL